MARSRTPTTDGPLFEKGEGQEPIAPNIEAKLEAKLEAGLGAGQESSPGLAGRLGWMPVALVGGLVAAGLWGAWVTRNLLASADRPPMVRVQLSGVVGEYVQAQARSAAPPEQVTAETRAFMAEIQRNLEARGSSGQIVLVGEAVLAGNVPDITPELRREVYAKVPMPQAAQASGGDVMGAMRAAMADPRGLPAVPTGNPLDAPAR